MNVLYKEAGERIRNIRVLKGYTRENLAERSGITPKFLYEIENGRKGFSAVVLYNISKSLRVSCDYIITGKESSDFDKSLVEVMQLFDQEQAKHISAILKQVYELL